MKPPIARNPIDNAEPLAAVDREKSTEFDFTDADRANLKKILAAAKGLLSPQEEYVINARFGLTANGVTQKPNQIAKNLRMTTERVNGLLVSAKKKLIKNPKLKDYYAYGESATAGSTSSGNIASVMPTNKTMIRRGPGGAPVAAQQKNKDGTVKNALDINTNIFGGKPVSQKRKTTNEELAILASEADVDHEVQMARAELYKLAHYAIELHKILKNVSEQEGLEGWVQSKITKASDYISSVYHHLNYQENEMENISPIRMPAAEGTDAYKDSLRAKLDEKAKSKAQQKFMGMVHAAQKGEKPASKEVAKVAKDMPKKAAKDYAATKHKGKPEHVKKKNESFDFHAKQILGEGKDYQNYLELSEAPIGDVVNKIKTSISKLARPVAAKAAQAVKSVPRSALPIVATVLMSLAAAQSANAGQSDIQAQLDKIDQTISQIGTTGDGGISNSTLNKFNTTSNDLTKSFNNTLDNLPGADATKSAGTTEVTRDQLKALYAKLGGGSQLTLTDLIKNGVNTDKVKNILTKMNLTDPMYIETALQQIQGSDLLPMINWIKNNK